VKKILTVALSVAVLAVVLGTVVASQAAPLAQATTKALSSNYTLMNLEAVTATVHVDITNRITLAVVLGPAMMRQARLSSGS